jgi:hypothetical protein
MTRSPPTRKDKFVNEIQRIADDNTYGYSQKPPSGRWGPDFDCASLIYYAANQAGFPVGSGGDKVRFTGTMLKDFEKAGFQILPFANVGISDLKIGDILLNLALHAEVYVGDGESISANASENGGFVGESGDQTDQEISKHPVITFDKGWDYILRPPDEDETDINGAEEGDTMPMNNAYPQFGSNTGPWPQTTAPMNTGYPQGNLGQMNGYSQANANMRMPYNQPMNQGWQQGYPQGQMPSNDLSFVIGIEGAKNTTGTPNSRMARFDEDQPLMYICSYDQNGQCNGINVYKFEECSEEMPQHLSPLMHTGFNNSMPQQQIGLTREDVIQIIEEMIGSEPSTSSSKSNGQPNAQSNATTRNGRTS